MRLVTWLALRTTPGKAGGLLSIRSLQSRKSLLTLHADLGRGADQWYNEGVRLLATALILFGCAVPTNVAIRRAALARCMGCLHVQVVINANTVSACQQETLAWCNGTCGWDDLCEAVDVQ